MTSHALKLQDLRSLIQGVEKTADREYFPFSHLPCGIPRGALVEVTGSGKTEAVAQFLAENPTLRVAWIEDQLTVYPCALLQRKVFLNRLLFIEAQREIFWAASQVLRSGIFECVVMSFQEPLNERVIRRLQLETEKANSGFFLLPEGCESTRGHQWALSMKLEVERTSHSTIFDLNILRQRGS